MLIPKKLNHRKHFRGKRGGVATRANKLDYGKYGIKALECGWITSRQIEAGRRAITRYLKRGGKVFIRAFPDRVVTKSAEGVRMGGGKAAPSHFVATVKPGTVIFELDGVSQSIAKEALRLATHKMPIKTVFIQKTEDDGGQQDEE